MLVMPAHSAGGQNRFVGTGVSRCNETLYRRFYSPDLSVSLSFSRFYDRESAVVVANDGYLPTITVYLCVCESDGVIRREVFPIPRGSLWIMLNPRYHRATCRKELARRYLSPSRYIISQSLSFICDKAEMSRSLIMLLRFLRTIQII